MIWRLGRIDRADERLVDPAPRVGLDLEEVVQALVAQPLDLGFRECRVEQDLGDQLQRRFQASGRDVDPDGQRIPAGVGVDRRPEAFSRLDERDRLVALRALGERAGGQHRRAGDAGRLLDGAAGDDDRGRDERPAGQVGDQDGEAVRQSAAGDGREVVRAGRAGLRPIGDDRTVALRVGRRAHAATSSSVAVSLASVLWGERHVVLGRPSGR